MTSYSGHKILCVDDSQDSCELFRFVLSDAGYEVQIAQSLDEGLQAAEASDFGLYLIDLCLPDGTGFDLIDGIRAINSLTPIVVCSADVRASVQTEILRRGAQHFFAKPIEPDQFVKTIANLLTASATEPMQISP